ncbi:MAG: fibronectin type III domain-containing protein [Nitrososphaeraceae archaeon]
MKSVHENTNAKSAVQTTAVSSYQYITDHSSTILKPTTTTSSPLPISNKTLSVYGNIDLTNSSVRLEPFMILPGSKYTTRPANSSFSINLLDSEGKILARYPFNPKISTYLPENKHNVLALLSEAVPYVLSTKQIVISKDGKELASRSVSAHTPQVKVIFPNGGEMLKDKFTIRWQASDVDGDHLTYSLHYSTDNGDTWQTITKNIKEESQLTINPNELPGSTKALFRVIATDGINTAIDDSDHTFTIVQSTSTH